MTPTQHDSIVAHGALRLLAVGVTLGARNRVVPVATGRTVERLSISIYLSIYLSIYPEVSFLGHGTTTLPSPCLEVESHIRSHFYKVNF